MRFFFFFFFWGGGGMPNFASPDHFCLLMLLLLIIWSPNLAPPDHFARFICSSSLFSSSRCAPLDNFRSLFRSHFALLYWLVLYIFFHFAFPYHLLSWLTLLTILLFLFCSYSPICFPYLAPLVYFLEITKVPLRLFWKFRFLKEKVTILPLGNYGRATLPTLKILIFKGKGTISISLFW